jgi:hypothetical protein
VDKISEFVEWYTFKHTSQIDLAINTDKPSLAHTGGKTVSEKKTVLDLCAHMFHPKDISQDISGTMEYNEMKQEEKIKEFEQMQGNLIFECFQDEVN